METLIKGEILKNHFLFPQFDNSPNWTYSKKIFWSDKINAGKDKKVLDRFVASEKSTFADIAESREIRGFVLPLLALW